MIARMLREVGPVVVVKVRDVRVPFADEDVAHDFAAWAVTHYSRVEILDDTHAAIRRTPEEVEAADALTAEYARALASSTGA